MIDITNLVFDTVFNGVQTARPDVTVTKGFIEQLANFPCITITETDNAPLRSTDTEDTDNYCRIQYQVEAFSDKAGTAQSECRELLNLVDGIMLSMKFRRRRMNHPLNIDRTIFRQYAIYEAVVQAGITTTTQNGNDVVTTTTFHMYRR